MIFSTIIPCIYFTWYYARPGSWRDDSFCVFRHFPHKSRNAHNALVSWTKRERPFGPMRLTSALIVAKVTENFQLTPMISHWWSYMMLILHGLGHFSAGCLWLIKMPRPAREVVGWIGQVVEAWDGLSVEAKLLRLESCDAFGFVSADSAMVFYSWKTYQWGSGTSCRTRISSKYE